MEICILRVVRFYQRCSPHPPLPPPPLPPPPVSPRPCLHQLPRPLPPCQLVANLFANFRAQWACWTSTAGFGLANSSPISSPTSARSGHCWTSTAGFRSEWARLDLNRQVLSAVGTAGPQLPASDLSGHGWTSIARF